MTPLRLDFERVKHLRAQMQCSLQEAKTLAMREVLLAALQDAETVADLKPIIAHFISTGR